MLHEKSKLLDIFSGVTRLKFESMLRQENKNNYSTPYLAHMR